MPFLAKKLLIFAAVDGLLLQPASLKSPESGGVRIEYGTNNITSILKRDDSAESSPLEVHGIVGLLNLVSSSYLISITRREQVAQIREKPVYRITDVTLIPLKSKEAAEQAIAAAQKLPKQNARPAGEETDDSEDAETSSIATAENDELKQDPDDEAGALELEPPREGALLQKSTTFLKDVVQEKGKYGRFAGKWFSRSGSKESVRRQSGLLSGRDPERGLTKVQEQQAKDALPDDETGDSVRQSDNKQEMKEEAIKRKDDEAVKQQSVIEHLTPRILKSARLYFSSSGFYFSYEHDISGSLAQRSHSPSSIPLWKRFDELFFWNRHLVKPFTDAGQDTLVLPLLQGFVGQRAFSIARVDETETAVVAEAVQDSAEVLEKQTEDAKLPSPSKEEPGKHEFLLTLISRRSVKRAGLRYLRRGIDDDGNVANNVETEQILSPQSWSDSEKTFSLLQTRGSIPLFFSQTPYSFKPLPVMFGSEVTNQTAFVKHFAGIVKRYGRVYAASLVDKHGTEAKIGESYEKHAKMLNENDSIDGKQLDFEWFDFHSACKGMRFENVQILMDTLRPSLESFGWIVKQNDRTVRQQTGILRTNCMDCLDRTNVVQSAVAGLALQQQLAELGLKIDLKTDPKTSWFNTLWADNGDAISKQYAGTSALKGDFTRTRKRNWTGALSDFSLTLNRYYNNIFGDYFLQTNIDYYLGNASPAVFDEFETNMMSRDYALDMRQVRQNAIDTCIKIVLEDPKEDLVAGWTLSCPHESNTLRSLPFEECVLLLTDAALYFCRFDWNTEKVGSFERVDLLDVREIWRGSYITNALGPTHLDESKNVGFALRYKTEGPSTVRTNTRSLSVAESAEYATKGQNYKGQKANPKEAEARLLAFKALPPKTVAAQDEDHDLSAMSEADLTKYICEEIHRTIGKAIQRDQGVQHADEAEKAPEVQEKDVISVAEAQRSTGYMESIGYSLKKIVWS